MANLLRPLEVLPLGGGGRGGRERFGPDREVIRGAGAERGGGLQMAIPESVGGAREAEERGDLGAIESTAKGLAPSIDGCDLRALEVLHDLVAVERHARVWNEPVVNGIRPARRQGGSLGGLGGPWHAIRHGLAPAWSIAPAPCACGKEIGGKGLAAGPDEGVAMGELHTKPRHMGAFENGIQPQRNLAQLDSGGVEIHAEDIVIGEAHFDPLLLTGIVLVRDGAAGFLLLESQVGLGQLVHRLVEKRRRAHGHLADGELKNIIGTADFLQEFLQGILHRAVRKALGCVERCGLVAVAAREAVEVAAFFMAEQAAWLAAQLVNALILGVVANLRLGHKIGVVHGIVFLVLRFYLVEIGLCEEAGIGKEVLINSAELVDAQLGIRDATRSGIAARALLAQREAVHDLLQNAVAELHLSENGSIRGVEEMALEGGYAEIVADRGGPHL